MVEETYLKQIGDNAAIVSFEGDVDDINRIRKYVEHMDDKTAMCSDKNEEDVLEYDAVNKPAHYRSGRLETIQKIERVIDGLPANQAFCLANVLKYFDRAGLKDDAEQDLDKAQNYAYRLVTGKWIHEQ